MATALPLLAILSTATSKGAACLPCVVPECQEVDGRLSGGPLEKAQWQYVIEFREFGTRLAVQCDRVKLFKCCSWRHQTFPVLFAAFREWIWLLYCSPRASGPLWKKSLFLMATKLSYIFRYFSFLHLKSMKITSWTQFFLVSVKLRWFYMLLLNTVK